MKLLTLNTHSLAEPGYEEKLLLFAEMIQKEQPEVFALQEVNQRISSEPVEAGEGEIKGDGMPLLLDLGGSQAWL